MLLSTGLFRSGSSRPPAGPGHATRADILRGLDVTVPVVAGESTYDVLTDDALMAAHRLELPWGFGPRRIGSLPG